MAVSLSDNGVPHKGCTRRGFYLNILQVWLSPSEAECFHREVGAGGGVERIRGLTHRNRMGGICARVRSTSTRRVSLNRRQDVNFSNRRMRTRACGDWASGATYMPAISAGPLAREVGARARYRLERGTFAQGCSDEVEHSGRARCVTSSTGG